MEALAHPPPVKVSLYFELLIAIILTLFINYYYIMYNIIIINSF